MASIWGTRFNTARSKSELHHDPMALASRGSYDWEIERANLPVSISQENEGRGLPYFIALASLS